MKEFFQDKRKTLFIFLAGFFLTNALIAEIIGTKIFSLEATLGLLPAQIQLWGDWILDFNLTAGVILWPFVFITTDIINEYFGKSGVKRISFLTAGFIAYMFLTIYLVTLLSPAQFWLDVNATDADGQPTNINHAFNTIFTQGLGIIVGSLLAFLLGQLLDVFIFQKLRRITGSRMIWLRATGSTLVSQGVDSFVVLFIAFYFLGNWSFEQVLAVGIINYLYKFVVALVLTPLLYIAHYGIDRYLGKELSENMMQEATEQQGFF
ncbi:queuosine precursor transporter [Cytophagales bacterium LB-30]|uniref:Probable queuosine precursor transporter n=1 Tax=Shiella aurantiaca TaxID=3058365 RepID=A0ABT8F451_9BACT|nr:queuosine precursor transporter [Shiella aurantiaca]MDN4165212.1 queuosine precursor transporter [Shiella aurantiaca]